MLALLIESNIVNATATLAVLNGEGICVNTIDMGEDGLDLCRRDDYDIVIVAAQLEDMSGLDVIRGLRKAGVRIPVIVLAASLPMDQRVKLLEAGADEVMLKPYHVAELVARVGALVRRSRGHADARITTGPLTVNLAARNVQVCGTELHVTNKEYQVLELLSLRRGAALNAEVFINHLYTDGEGPESRTVELFICHLRKKLAAASGGDRCIETVGRRGYMLPSARAA
jgi:two-component system cell cycle response regulator CtrA